MNKKRIVVLTLVLIIVSAAAVGGWVIGSRIESPAEAAARTAPPEPSPILNEVERRVLRSTITTRGTARFGLPQPISIAPSNLKSQAGVLTTLPGLNTQIAEGDVLLTASGRPLLVLQGDIPTYRDMVPGIAGQDVRQLEEALVRLGFDPGDVDGTYDEQTSDAVGTWYAKGGWDAFGPTPQQLAVIRDLEKHHGDAMKNKLASEAAAGAAELAVISASSKAEHDNKVAAADVEAQLAALEKAKIDLVNAEVAIEAAKVIAAHKKTVAEAELAKARFERERLLAEEDGGTPLAVETAIAIADYANKSAKADISAKIYDRSLIVLDPRQTQTARDAADANLEVARAAWFKTKLEGELAVVTAKRDTAAAKQTFGLIEAAVKSAELEGKASINAAEIALQSAKHQVKVAEQLLELARGAVTSRELAGKEAERAAADALKLAQYDAQLAAKRVEQVEVDLALARSKLGNQVPVDEVVFLPSLPVRVHEVTAVVGELASGPLMAVTDNQLSIDATLPVENALDVFPNMPVEIDEGFLDISAKGTVDFVADTPGTLGVDAYRHYLRIRVDETNKQLQGRSLRLKIPIATTEGEVLTVPLNAVFQSADGLSRVQVKRDDKFEDVVVEGGLAVDGFVEVRPIEGELNEGDLVITGFDRGTEVLANELSTSPAE